MHRRYASNAMAIAPPLAEVARPITRAEYGRMIDAGLFAGERVELWKGVIVRMSPQKSPHAFAVQKLTELFSVAVVPTRRAGVRVQLPLALGDDSEPEPDIAVVEAREYRDELPTTALLVIEVADSSLRFDREFKAPAYAEAGIPEYWLVDVQRKLIEVHRDPTEAGYRTRNVRRGEEPCAPLAFPDVVVTASTIT
jgi:Uma2 family endonuclease